MQCNARTHGHLLHISRFRNAAARRGALTLWLWVHSIEYIVKISSGQEKLLKGGKSLRTFRAKLSTLAWSITTASAGGKCVGIDWR